MTAAALNKPWLTEGDNKVWESSGYRCEIKRVPSSGHLCGYVTIPKSHPWFGLSFNDDVTPIAELMLDECNAISAFCHALRDDKPENGRCKMDLAIRVHGGVTYGKPADSDEGWTIGFDCAHSGDYCPVSAAWFATRGLDRSGLKEIYRDMDYVTAETCRLAAQLRMVEDRGMR